MVVMGDGYTAADMPRFRAHLDKHLNVLWSIEPFRSYRNYINVYAVEVPSPESGITCDPEVRLQKNTTLGLEFGNAGGGGGGCTNINARGITPQRGREALIREYAAKATPQLRPDSDHREHRHVRRHRRIAGDDVRRQFARDRSSRRTSSGIRWDG